MSDTSLGVDLAPLECDGYQLLPAVFSPSEVQAILDGLEPLLVAERQQDASIRGREGTVYAARNVIDVWPAVRDLWRRPSLVEYLQRVLGPQFGLVRVLFFDKPPGRTWSLPWHKDLTIAVVPPDVLPAGSRQEPWRKLTHKAGVPHVEADQATLERMLTLRIHLDAAGAENGALWVLPGSHRRGKSLDPPERERTLIAAEAGDVLAMRPLLAHSSGTSAPETRAHRRILHLEFSGVRDLPHGFAWRDFIPHAP